MERSGWVNVDPIRAKAHPLYGVGGWLKAFLAALWISTILAVGGLYAMSPTATEETLRSASDAVSPFIVAKWFLIAMSTLVSALAAGHHRAFRPVAIVYLLSCNLIVLRVLAGGELEASAAFGAVIQSAIVCGPWVVYLSISRRVRITFEAQVKSDDPWLVTADKSAQPTRAPLSNSGVGLTASAEAMYEAVAREIESGTQRKGLWLQCFTEAGGDEKRQLVLYTEARIRELIHEEDGQRRLATLAADDISCAYPREAKYREMMSVLSPSPPESGTAQGPKRGA